MDPPGPDLDLHLLARARATLRVCLLSLPCSTGQVQVLYLRQVVFSEEAEIIEEEKKKSKGSAGGRVGGW